MTGPTSDPAPPGQRGRDGARGFAPETLIVVAAAWWTLAFNGALFSAARQGRDWTDPGAAALVLALGVALVALHAFAVALVAHRRLLKPALVLLTVVAAAASWFTAAYGTRLDPAMMRNVLRTDRAEAMELIVPGLLAQVALLGALPALLLAWMPVRQRRWREAVPRRLALLVGCLLALVLALWSAFQPLASLVRNERAFRYLATPANVLWSTGSVLAADARGGTGPREPIGLDARPGPSWAARRRPLVVVLVVGETARAANWGLGGYARQTTPALAAAGVIDFPHVTACGTDTETSVPCMFAPVGRRDYDAARIRRQQSLLHVVARAGVAVRWIDNQSGCKGVCDGLAVRTPDPAADPAACPAGRCSDLVLPAFVGEALDHATGTQLVVLHLMGNHGPAYAQRHPDHLARWLPECRDDDLRRCDREQIVNAYDNALLVTDHVLADIVARLKRSAGDVDSALLFVSDHGESLGEHGLYLHGMPYAIAPAVQKHVPMVWWHSDGFEAASGLAAGCLGPALARQAASPLSHDHLFHTLLGALDVRTALAEPALDLTAGCRAHAAP